MAYSDQATSRFINHEFNRRIKASHSIIQHALSRVLIAAQIVHTNYSTESERKNATLELQTLHNEFQFDAMYLKYWFVWHYPLCHV